MKFHYLLIIDWDCRRNYNNLQKPTYVLRPGGSITVEGSIDKKIDEKGPYDAESFPKKRVNIAVLYPERFKGEVELFIKQFRDGVPPRSGKEKYAPGIFSKK